MAAAEESIGIDAPVIVKQPAAADHHQAGHLDHAMDGGHIVPRHGLDIVGRHGLRGVAGGHHDAHIRTLGSKLRQGCGENGFVAGIAEAVVTDKKNHLFAEVTSV